MNGVYNVSTGIVVILVCKAARQEGRGTGGAVEVEETRCFVSEAEHRMCFRKRERPAGSELRETQSGEEDGLLGEEGAAGAR